MSYEANCDVAAGLEDVALDEAFDESPASQDAVAISAPSSACVSFQLPPAAARFFGRDNLVLALKERLLNFQETFVWAPAGMGKTALAAQAIHELGFASRESLAESPFPDGIIFVSFRAMKGDPEQIWEYLASTLAPNAPTTSTTENRARQACAGLRILIIVEGAETAAHRLPDALRVLAPENRRLILTRSVEQVASSDPIRIESELSGEHSLELLRNLTNGRVDDETLRGVCSVLRGHPLALTWAGCHLSATSEASEDFAQSLRQEKLPYHSQPGFESRTLQWLYQQRVRALPAEVQKLLHALGSLAPVSFPESVAWVIHGGEDLANESLKLLERHGFVRVLHPGSDHADPSPRYEFTHDLLYQFASASACASDALNSLADWAEMEIRSTIQSAKRTGYIEPLRQALLHASVILRADLAHSLGRSFLHKLLIYEAQDKIAHELGQFSLASHALEAVDLWLAPLISSFNPEKSWLREHTIICNRRGALQQAQGDIAGARLSFEQSLSIRQKLVTAEPTNAQWQRDLSVSYERMGDLQQAQGDLFGARMSFEQSLSIRQKLVATDPSNAQWQRGLGVSYERLGDLLKEQGDLTGAGQAFAQSFAIRQKLAAADPGNSQWQRDLSVILNKQGDLYQTRGNLGASGQSYSQGLAIAQKLVTGDPANTQWQRDLSVGYEGLGALQQTQGDFAGARQSFERTLSIRQKLVAANPANTQWQRDLSVSYNKLGVLQQTQGNIAGAAESFERDLAIARKLAAIDPANTQWQRDLSVSYERLGDLQQAQGNIQGARKSVEESLAISKRLVEADPANAQMRRDLSVSYHKLGDLQQAQGDLAGAARSFELGLTIARNLVAAEPGNRQWQRLLGVCLNKLGDLQHAQGDLTNASQCYEQSLAIRQKLVLADSANTQWQRDLSVSHNRLGALQRAQGDLTGARKSFGQDLAIAKKLAAAEPANMQWQRELGLSYDRLGALQQAQGDLDGASQSFEQSLMIQEKLAAATLANGVAA